MPRPALSASRSLDIIELLAAFPERRFTLMEIVRATEINTSSCHSVLSVLVERGYVDRSTDQKTYSLGAVPVALGQAGFRAQPLAARALRVATELLQELDTPVTFLMIVEQEILALFSLTNSSGAYAGMQAGYRMPFVAPSGMPFIAWGTEQEIDAWISRHTGLHDNAVVEEWRSDLKLTRERGYHAQMRTVKPKMPELMAELAQTRKINNYKNEIQRLINTLDHEMVQPKTIHDDEIYDVLLIASPVFDENGVARYNLCLGNFAKKLTGAQLKSHADRLMHACLETMRTGNLSVRQR